MEICKCGCGIEFCVCKELEALLNEEIEHKRAKNVQDCCNYCGCKIAFCKCKSKVGEIFEKDRCECTVQLDEELDGEDVECTCGCELGFCICQQLKPCKCFVIDDKLDFTCLEDRKTDHQKKRDKYLKYLQDPTLTEAKDQLGNELSDVILDELNSSLKEIIGMEPCLEGVQPPLWISPSDLLIGKQALKPPLTQKYIQALTHEGILELGQEIEERILDQKERDKLQALEEQEMNLRKIYEIREARLAAQIRLEEYEKKMQEIEKMSIAFEKKIKQITHSVQGLIQCYDRQLKVQTEWWRRKLKEEIGLATRNITQHFLDKLRKQEDILVSIFQDEIRRIEKMKKQEINMEGRKWQEKLRQLKHSLECKNIANLIFVLCKERRRCQSQQHTLEDNYKTKLLFLEQMIQDNNAKIQELDWKKAELEITLKVREQFLVGILKQFQKFINFALRASPTQGEFLLSIDRIMNDFLQEPTFDELYNEEEEPEVEIDLDVLDDEDIVEELESLISDAIKTTDALPSFTYKDKLYVREDYRNILSQRPIVKGDKMWNSDVDELIKILEKVSQAKKECKCGCEFEFCICHEFKVKEPMVDESQRCKCGCNIMNCICEKLPDPSLWKEMLQIQKDEMKTIYSGLSAVDSGARLAVAKPTSFADKESILQQPQKSTNGSLKSSMKSAGSYTSQVNRAEVGKTEIRKSLLATVDSVEIIRQSVSSKGLVVTEEHLHSRSVEIKKEVTEIEEKNPSMPTAEQDCQSVRSRKSSQSKRLCSVRDSVILRIASLRLEALTQTLEVQKRQKLAADEEKREVKDDAVTPSPASSGRLQPTPSKLLQASDSVEIMRSKSLLLMKEITKPPEIKVVGDPKSTEHVKTYEDFTRDRVNSLVNLLKEDRNLLNLFTACMR